MPDEAEISAKIYSSDTKIFFKYFNSRIVRSKDRERQRMSNYRSLSNSFIASTKELSEAYFIISLHKSDFLSAYLVSVFCATFKPLEM